MNYGALDASYLCDWLLCSDAQFEGKVTQFLKVKRERQTQQNEVEVEYGVY